MLKAMLATASSRIVYTVSRTLLRNFVYTIRSGAGKGLKRKGGLGFLPRRTPREVAFLTGMDLHRQTVFDVGGYEGVFTIFFARAVGENGRVIVFEPNPENCRKIAANTQLNGFNNVEVRPIALGEKSGQVALVFPILEPARGSIWGEYQASLRRKQGVTTIAVEIDSLDNQIALHGLAKPDFVKIDVEAAEMSVLEGMRATIKTHRPKLFVELHSGVELRRLIGFLIESGYRIRHVESNLCINASNSEEACPGHIYCV